MFDRNRGGEYGHNNPNQQIRIGIGRTISEALRSAASGINSLFPKKDSFQNNPYYPYYDYRNGVIRRNDSIRPGLVAKRVLIAGAVLAGIGTAWFNRSTIIDLFQSPPPNVAEAYDPTETETSLTSTPEPATPTEEQPPTITPRPDKPEELLEYIFENELGVIIKYDRDGTPISYKVNGQETMIDKNQLNQLQEKAKEESLPQIVFFTNIPKTEVNEADETVDRPFLKEKPTDMLTEEELATRGIKIIQGENVKLHLRESAFLPGSSLDSFTPGSDNKLTIVLVDDPSVSRAYMTDPKYDEVLGDGSKYNGDMEEYRQKQLDYWEEQKESIAKELKQMIDSNQTEHLDFMRKSYIYAQLKLEVTRTTDISNLALLAGMTEIAGCYVESTRTVFVSVGQQPDDVSETKVVMYVDENGKIYTTNFQTMMKANDYVPKLTQSFPRPSDFAYKAEHGEEAPETFPDREDRLSVKDDNYSFNGYSPDSLYHYPYGAQTPAQILRHEIKHDEMITAYPTGSEYFDKSEWWTDMEVMGDIDRAFQEFLDSGFTNDDWYWAIFEIDGNFIRGNEVETDKAAV